MLGLFCLLFGIKLDDVKQKELREYSSLHDFFTRVMKEETRPICPDHSLVCEILSAPLQYLSHSPSRSHQLMGQ